MSFSFSIKGNPLLFPYVVNRRSVLSGVFESKKRNRREREQKGQQTTKRGEEECAREGEREKPGTGTSKESSPPSAPPIISGS